MKIRKAIGRNRRTLYVKNPIAHDLAEQLSKRMGVNLNDAVIAALQESLQKRDWPINRTRVDAISAAIGNLPVVDARSPDEILGFDSFGIPR